MHERKPQTPFEKMENFSRAIGKHYELKRMTYEALLKYAHVSLRRREITIDFEGTSLKRSLYPTYEAEDGSKWRMTITRENYRDHIINLSHMAFNLYSTYLSGDAGARAAANEVKLLVNDLFPQNM